MGNSILHSEDKLDDGTIIALKIEISDEVIHAVSLWNIITYSSTGVIFVFPSTTDAQ